MKYTLFLASASGQTVDLRDLTLEQVPVLIRFFTDNLVSTDNIEKIEIFKQ